MLVTVSAQYGHLYTIIEGPFLSVGQYRSLYGSRFRQCEHIMRLVMNGFRAHYQHLRKTINSANFAELGSESKSVSVIEPLQHYFVEFYCPKELSATWLFCLRIYFSHRTKVPFKSSYTILISKKC